MAQVRAPSVSKATVRHSKVRFTFRQTERAVSGRDRDGRMDDVKEQMPGTYARELAARGNAALAFDFSGWGESEGVPRFVEDPVVKTADIHSAVAFLAGLEEVDGSAISGLGVCASSGYKASAVADSDKLRNLALAASWLHDPEMAEGIHGGAEAVAPKFDSSRLIFAIF